jgi:hypothetical protein
MSHDIPYIRAGKRVSRRRFNRTARRYAGRPVKRSSLASVGTTAGYSEGNPGFSNSLGCLPEQVAEMNESLHKTGNPGASFNREGKVVFTSRKARRKFMADAKHFYTGMRNIYDADGGYGDG